MALIKCEDCGKEYSDQATNCPNCGSPSPAYKQYCEQYNRKQQMGGVIQFVLGLIGVITFLALYFFYGCD